MHFFITGHTGFKGSWLVTMLTQAGHRVSGVALAPEPGSLFEIAGLANRVHHDARGDIRQPKVVRQALQATMPDVVIHLAAQPLVRESYRNPRLTFESNVNGTFNVLESVSRCESVKAQLLITTDKVYRNVGARAGYREDDSLGGLDPYSASKAMADILIQSWAHSFSCPPTGIARAGNVVGGGDIGQDRLLPDLMRSFGLAQPALVRYPSAVRPWQHVLDCLNGYLLLIEHLLRNNPPVEAWNFGPDPAAFASVDEVSRIAAQAWGPQAVVKVDQAVHPREDELLTLDSSKARDQLGWTDRLSLTDAIDWTVAWTRAVAGGQSPLVQTIADVERFERT